MLLPASSAWAQGLQDKLDARRDAFLAQAPAEVVASQTRALRALEDSGIYGRVLKVGDRAPDFTLRNADGEEIRLAALLEKGPVVLTWYRGGWCPYCNIALTELSAKHDRFKALGASFVALTPELPDATAASVKEHGLPFEVLTDAGHHVAEDYGLVFALDAETRDRYEERFKLAARSGEEAAGRLPLPATYVLGSDGIITYAFVDADYRRRAEPERIVDALQAIKNGPTGRHLVLQFWENTWNPPYDLALIDRNMSADFILTSAGRDIVGRDAFRRWVQDALAHAPGLRMENLDCFTSEDRTRVVSRWIARATSGATPDAEAASEQPFQFTGIALWEIKDGKLSHNWVERSAPAPIPTP